MILIIDNYDSFVHNLARYVRQLSNQEVQVFRHDKIDVKLVQELAPSAIIISPGPCRPVDSGNTLEIVATFIDHIPMLGVCLGHQAIVEALGGIITQSIQPVHGKPDRIFHDQSHSLFEQIPSPFNAGRYHSLIVNPDSVPAEIDVIARNDSEIIMAVTHKVYPVFGVQFHPESVLTEHGYRLLHNFLTIAEIQSSIENLELVL